MSDTAIFIHSTGTGPFMWTRFLPHVAPLGTLTPSNLGYAPNPPIPAGQPCPWPLDVANLQASLPAAGNIHLVAHSYGGMLALKVAAAEPRVRSLWLWEPVLFGTLRREPLDGALDADSESLFSDRSFLHDEDAGGKAAWLKTFIDYWNGPGAWEALPDNARQASLKVGWKMFQEVRSTCLDDAPFAAYATNIPITLVAGSVSPAASRAMVAQLKHVNPQAVVESVDGAGHLGPVTHSKIAAASLGRHMARLPSLP